MQKKKKRKNNKMEKSRDLFKKIRATKGIFQAKIGRMKNRNFYGLNRS